MEPRPDGAASAAPFTVTLIVGTFGADYWRLLGQLTAKTIQAAQHHPFDAVRASHEKSLKDARNFAAVVAETTWLCFVDADDTLGPGYVRAMQQEAAPGRLLAPQVAIDDHRTRGEPESLARRDITHLNPCVIGTLVERDRFLAAGGFLDEPIYEDWSLWLRCVRLGARVHHVDGAVYRARLRADSRNQQPEATKQEWYRRIRDSYA